MISTKTFLLMASAMMSSQVFVSAKGIPRGSVFSKIDYNPDMVKFTGSDSLEISLEPVDDPDVTYAKGSRIQTKPLYHGKFCGTVEKFEAISGSCLAIYLSSDEQSKQDGKEFRELDFELTGYKWPSEVWVTAHRQEGDERREYETDEISFKVDRTEKHYISEHINKDGDNTFCIARDVKNEKKAKWTINGHEVASMELDDWGNYPLKGYVSYWGDKKEPFVSDFEIEDRYTAVVKDITLDELEKEDL